MLLFGAGVEMFGFMPCLVAALLFAFAPLPVYYSRYFIHETLFVAATLGLILSAGLGVALRRTNWSAEFHWFTAALAGFCAALMLACKETAVIHFFAIALALIAIRFERWPPARPGRKSGRNTPGRDRRSIRENNFGRHVHFPGHGNFIVHLVRPKLVGARRFDLRSSQFYRARGRPGPRKIVLVLCRVLAGGWSGGMILVVAAFGFFCAIRHPSAKAGFVIAIYGLLIFVIYSAIPYKTPWLALNFWLPLALFAALPWKGCGSPPPNFPGA